MSDEAVMQAVVMATATVSDVTTHINSISTIGIFFFHQNQPLYIVYQMLPLWMKSLPHSIIIRKGCHKHDHQLDQAPS